jgi:CheY-like chemotaxis protein
MVCTMLAQFGYHCLEAADGEEGLRMIQSRPGIDLVLTDVMMPIMGGIELARRISMLYPGIRIVFMSGYSDDPVVRAIERTPSIFLPKPFTTASLTEKVQTTLDQPWNGLPEANSGAGAR